jgi:hypothetical protein
MSDTTLNQFVASGTAADMAGFTPSPPSPASGPASGYFFFQTDTGDTYSWDQGTTAWVKIASSSATGNVTTTGSPASGNLTKFTGTTSISNGDLSGDITTSGTLVTAIGANKVTTTTINASAVTLAKIANAAANSKWLGSGASGSGSAYTENSFGSGLSVASTTLSASTPVLTRAITLAMTGGGSALPTGIAADVYVPYACTITGVTMLADQTGSVIVDIWKVAYGSYPATVTNTITASDLPTISSGVTSQDTTLTGWTTSISAGDTLRFNVNSVTAITRLNLTLTVTVS